MGRSLYLGNELWVDIFSDELTMMFVVGVINAVDLVYFFHRRNVYFIIYNK